jgi:hypothetical protein
MVTSSKFLPDPQQRDSFARSGPMGEKQKQGIQNQQQIQQRVVSLALLVDWIHGLSEPSSALDSSIADELRKSVARGGWKPAQPFMSCYRKAPDSHSSPSPPILRGSAARRNTDKFLRRMGICCTRGISTEACF